MKLANKLCLLLLFALIILPGAFAQVNYRFLDKATNLPVSNVIVKAYTCTDSFCYTPNPLAPYVDAATTSSSYSFTMQNGWNAAYFFADGYFFMKDMAWISYPGLSESIDVMFVKGQNCHAVVDNLNVPYEVETNLPVLINVPVSAQTDVHSPFGIANNAPYYLPAQNNPSDPLFEYLAADVSVKFDLLDESNNVVYTETKNVKIFSDTTMNVPFAFTSPGTAGKYHIRVTTNVTDNQCASTNQDETNKDLIVVQAVPNCYTLINNLETSNPYPTITEPFTVTAHIFGHLSVTADDVDVLYEVRKTSDHSLVYTDSTTIPTETAQDVSFTWTPTEVGDYDITMYTSIANGICSASNFENANILGFYIKDIPKYTLTFHVKDGNGNGIDVANIDLLDVNNNVHHSATTNADGIGVIANLLEGDYKYTITKTGFQDYVYPAFHVATDADIYAVMSAVQPPQYTLTINVIDGLTNAKLQNAAIVLSGPVNANANTDANGVSTFASLPMGTYNIVVSKAGYENKDDQVAVDSNKAITVTLQDINDAPVFDAVSAKTITELQTLTFTVNATDPDELNGLSYFALSMPQGATFDAATRTFSFTPNNDFADPTLGYSNTEAVFRVTDSRGGSSEMTVPIRVNNALRTGSLAIACLPNAVVDSKQACTVTVYEDDGDVMSGANVVFTELSTSMTGTTNALGNVVFEYDVTGASGTRTVNVVATKIDYNPIAGSSTYNALSHAYDVDYIKVFDDVLYTHEQYTFYRGQDLYLKFRVVDINDGSIVPSANIVTSVTLVSQDGGGRIDLTYDNYDSEYYYFKLQPIPLTHDFIGLTGLYAIAINYADNSGGEGVTYITILNNPPTNTLPDTIEITQFDQVIDLTQYINDVEDNGNLNIRVEVSPDDESVLYLSEGEERSVRSNIIYTSDSEYDGLSEIYVPYSHIDLLATDAFGSDYLTINLRDGTDSESPSVVLLKDESFARLPVFQSYSPDNLRSYYYASYLGEIDNHAAVSMNPAVVVSLNGTNLIASPKDDGETRYIITIEDVDGEISSKIVTFIVENFYPEQDIVFEYDGAAIVPGRTVVDVSADITDYGILSSNPVAIYYDWSVYNSEIGFYLTSQDIEFSFVPDASVVYNVDLYSMLSNGKYAFINELYRALDVTKPEPPKPEPTNYTNFEMYINDVNLPNGLEYRPGDDIIVELSLKNSGDINMHNIKIVAAIPELLVAREIGPFDMTKSRSETKTITMPIPDDSELGEYTVIVDIVDNGQLNRRVGRQIEVVG